MANNIVQAEANRLLDASLGTAAYTAPTGAMKLALATTTGTATTAGTEVAGGSYARQTVAFTAATAGATANSGAVTYTSMPAATVTGVDIYDSNGTPRRCWFGALTTPKTTGAGDTLSIAVSALTIALA
ncbi:phage tail fiber protein [Micromonosporaceae bacterium Da 78-11]